MRRGAFVQEGGRKCPEDGIDALGFDDAVVDDDDEGETGDDCSGARVERRITPLAEMNDRLKLEVDRAIRQNQNSNARTEEDKKAMVQGWITTAQAWTTRASVDAETLARTGGSMLVPDAPLGGSVKRRKDFLEKSKENGSARKKTATSQRGEPSTTPVRIVRSTPTPVSVSFPERGVSVGSPPPDERRLAASALASSCAAVRLSATTPGDSPSASSAAPAGCPSSPPLSSSVLCKDAHLCVWAKVDSARCTPFHFILHSAAFRSQSWKSQGNRSNAFSEFASMALASFNDCEASAAFRVRSVCCLLVAGPRHRLRSPQELLQGCDRHPRVLDNPPQLPPLLVPDGRQRPPHRTRVVVATLVAPARAHTPRR